MTDPRLDRALSDAIADLAGSDAPPYLDDILERTRRTRQRPWWTFPGRFLTMTTTIRFATVGLLGLTVGLAALTLPLERSSREAVPGAAGTEPDPYTGFAGRWDIGSPEGDGPITPNGPAFYIDQVWHPTIETAGDPRLDGVVTIVGSGVEFPDVGPRSPAGGSIWDQVIRIDSDDGAWVGEPDVGRVRRSGREALASTAVLDGTGAYEGYTAVMQISPKTGTTWDISGWIFEGSVNPPGGPRGADLWVEPDGQKIAPSEFDVRWQYTGYGRSHDGVQGDGQVYQYEVLDATDPRFEGNVVLYTRGGALPGLPRSSWNGAFRLENDEGSWNSDPMLIFAHEDFSGSTETVVLKGGGAYAGLQAVAEMAYESGAQYFDIRGLVLGDELPEDAPTVALAD